MTMNSNNKVKNKDGATVLAKEHEHSAWKVMHLQCSCYCFGDDWL